MATEAARALRRFPKLASATRPALAPRSRAGEPSEPPDVLLGDVGSSAFLGTDAVASVWASFDTTPKRVAEMFLLRDLDPEISAATRALKTNLPSS